MEFQPVAGRVNVKKEKYTVVGALGAILVAAILYFAFLAVPCTAVAAAMPPVPHEEARYVAKVDGREFAVFAEGRWQKKFLKGGVFPGRVCDYEGRIPALVSIHQRHECRLDTGIYHAEPGFL